MATAAVESGGKLAKSKNDARGTLPSESGSVAKAMSTEQWYDTPLAMTYPTPLLGTLQLSYLFTHSGKNKDLNGIVSL